MALVLRNPKIHSYLKHPTRAPRATEAPWAVPALCARYKFPTGLAGGGVIGIIELGGGWTSSDMAAFFASIGQPVPSITDVSVDGTTNTPGSDDDFEVALDIQASAAAYYAATGKPAAIRVYWVQDMATGLRAAAKDGCSVFSMSWGAYEADWNSGTGAGSCADMQAAALAGLQAGMVSFAASGDNDSDDGARKASVDCPASCPSVIGCGGTTLTASTEVVWNNDPGNMDGEGTGGGYSKVFPAQSWQVGIPAAPAGLGRMVPDVASCADPNTGIEIYCQGAATVVGGTSAAAPLWAGLVAACGVRLGSIAPTFYRTPSAFTDIVSGSNGAYSAGVGPDPCSGMGSPLGAAVATMLGTTVAPPAPPPPPPPGSPPSHAAVDAALAALQAATTAYEQAVANYAATLVRTGGEAPPQTAPGRPVEPRPEPPATPYPQPRPEPPQPGREPPGLGPSGGRGRP
jgi:kumamolisin